MECAPQGVQTVYFDGLDALPHFNPDLDADPLPPRVAALRSAIEYADAVLFCTPEYAGTLPGSFKNLLDWCVGGTSLTDKPVAWVNVAADPRRGGGAAATLATVLGYVQARIVDEACVHIPVDRAAGTIASAATRELITAALRDLVAVAG
jgi:NAD(P)H-dependent FMN reductase